MVLIRLGQQPLSATNFDLVPAFLVAGVLSLVVTVPASLAQFGGDDGLIAGLVTWVIGIGSYWLGERRNVRVPEVLLAIGGAAIIAGPAIVAIETTNAGTLLGLASAVACLAVGATPGRLLSHSREQDHSSSMCPGRLHISSQGKDERHFSLQFPECSSLVSLLHRQISKTSWQRVAVGVGLNRPRTVSNCQHKVGTM